MAVQRATARDRGTFAYLEIGSHLGGSIQPYLLDERCRAVYSIDPRPLSQLDDRKRGHIVHYEGNSTERMRERLRSLDAAQFAKVVCFESDASLVDPARLVPRPDVGFIDGEHTRRAVLSDYAFCRKALSPTGTILFDDFPIVYPAVIQIVRSLRASGEAFAAFRLDGKVFGLFLDPGRVDRDPHLSKCRERRRFTLARYTLKALVRRR